MISPLDFRWRKTSIMNRLSKNETGCSQEILLFQIKDYEIATQQL